jgi:hypothetical protein
MKNLGMMTLILFFVFNTVSSFGEGKWTSLFNGKNLEGWKQLNGKAKYEVRNGEIIGTTISGVENSFLTTEKKLFGFCIGT